jgi:hypothetical protein
LTKPAEPLADEPHFITRIHSTKTRKIRKYLRSFTGLTLKFAG